MTLRCLIALGLGPTLALGVLAPVARAQTRGPSSTRDPFLVPVAPGVRTIAILSVGDAPAGSAYRMVGGPDGLGIAGRRGNTFTLLMNHELGRSAGIVRAHGQKGAFVSRWQIRAGDLSVLSGADLIQSAVISSGTPAFERFCSGDLAPRSAFFPLDPLAPALFLNGEESGSEGRAFAHVASGPHRGQSYELPALGNLSFENCVARPFPDLRTVVACTDDSSPGQVYVYLGTKRALGNEVERAGLAQGVLFGVRVPGVRLEDRASGLGGATRFELAPLGDVSGRTGARLQIDSAAAQVTEFLRPEDAAWDPGDPRLLYFATTDRFDAPGQVGRSRLWQLCFDDVRFPELGGRISALLDGTEGPQMMDNLTVNRRGDVLVQEDPGGQSHRARVWRYAPSRDALTLLAEADARFFSGGSPEFLTEDEESSGIIDASRVLGAGWFLLDVQVHTTIAGELVSDGQLLALYDPASP